MCSMEGGILCVCACACTCVCVCACVHIKTNITHDLDFTRNIMYIETQSEGTCPRQQSWLTRYTHIHAHPTSPLII